MHFTIQEPIVRDVADVQHYARLRLNMDTLFLIYTMPALAILLVVHSIPELVSSLLAIKGGGLSCCRLWFSPPLL